MTNTTLTAVEVAKLSALITGGGYKRSATKEAAVARFLKVAADAGIAAINVKVVLAADTLAGATELLEGYIASAKGQPAAAPIKADPHAASNKLIADAIARDPELAAMASAEGPGFARFKKNADVDALRAQTLADAEAARAAVVRPDVPQKDRTPGVDAFAPKSSRKAALAFGDEPAAKPAKAPKAPKAKPAKAEGDAATRARLDLEAKIAAVVANPKKPGSRSHARFALYQPGTTAADFIKACVAAGFPEAEAKADLSWDRRKGFITFETAAA